jgi:hypothetical protein
MGGFGQTGGEQGPIGVIPIIGPIIEGLLSLFSLFSAPPPNPLVATSGIGNIAFSTMQLGTAFLRDVVGSIKNVFQSIWNGVIVALLKKLLDAYTKLRDLLNRVFGPVIRFLKQLRKIYDDYFNRFVKPFLRVLQNIRKFLTLFRLLGFKWAAKLDGYLAKIQQDILKAYTLLRSELNSVITYLDLIVDPSAILRRNPLFAALIRSAPELRNMILQAETRPLTQDELDTQARDKANASYAGQKANYLTYYSQGNLTPDDDAMRKQFALEFSIITTGQGEQFV